MSRKLGSKWEVRVLEQEDSVGGYLSEIEEGHKDSAGVFTLDGSKARRHFEMEARKEPFGYFLFWVQFASLHPLAETGNLFHLIISSHWEGDHQVKVGPGIARQRWPSWPGQCFPGRPSGRLARGARVGPGAKLGRSGAPASSSGAD